MKIGFVGAGRASCSLGKYFQMKGNEAGIQVTGYYSLMEEDTRWAAEFTDSKAYTGIDELIKESDSIVLSTFDGAIKDVWNSMNKELIKGKCICHLSGSLSSDIFSGIESYGAYAISIHPMFAFSSKESVYEQLNQVSFTLEGDDYGKKQWGEVFDKLGNSYVLIDSKVKPLYHAAASLLSNHVVAVLATGYDMLMQCGFSLDEARHFSEILVKNNVEHVIETGVVDALTGPIERNDTDTILKHIEAMDDSQKVIYGACGRKIVEIAKEKNPQNNYEHIDSILAELIQESV